MGRPKFLRSPSLWEFMREHFLIAAVGAVWYVETLPSLDLRWRGRLLSFNQTLGELCSLRGNDCWSPWTCCLIGKLSSRSSICVSEFANVNCTELKGMFKSATVSVWQFRFSVWSPTGFVWVSPSSFSGVEVVNTFGARLFKSPVACSVTTFSFCGDVGGLWFL